MIAVANLSMLVIPFIQHGDYVENPKGILQDGAIAAAYFFNLLFLIELLWRIYAKGLRRTWKEHHLPYKLEFFI